MCQIQRAFARAVLLGVVVCVPFSHALAADNSKPPANANVFPKQGDLGPPIIYVPYRSIGSILSDPQSTAVVPLKEYLRLRESARNAGRRLAAVVTEAHYAAKVEKDIVRIQAALSVQAVDSGWSEATINFGNAAIGKVSSENNRVLVRGLGRGSYALLLPAAGAYPIGLELSIPVRSTPDGRGFDLDCPSVAITTFELAIPEGNQTIELSPSAPTTSIESEKGSSRIRVNLAATPRIAARWHPRVGTQPASQVLAAVENRLHVTVGDGVVRTAATLAYKVFRGELGQLRVAAPLGDRILDVSSPQGPLRSWRTVSEPNRQLVIADLLANTAKEITLEVHAERPLPSDGFDVAGLDDKGRPLGIHAVDVVRESGELIVSHREGIDVSVESERGLVRVDATELPAPDRKPGATFYKFYSPAVRLRLEARPVEPQIAVANHGQLVFTEDELRLTANLKYDVTRTGVFELSAKIPDGLTVDSVESPAMKAYHVEAKTGKLVVTLNEKQQGTIEVVLKGHREFGAAATVDLPLVEPTGVVREDGLVDAFVPEGIELTSDEGKTTGAHPEPSADNTLPPNVLHTTRRAGAWSYHHRPVAIRVNIVHKPTRLTARIATTVNVGQESTAIVAHVDFSVENAGIDTFRIAVPEAVADKVQIEAESGGNGGKSGGGGRGGGRGGGGEIGIKQRSRDEKAVDGWVGWTIVLERKVTGNHRFQVKYDLKPKVSGGPPAPAGAAKPEAGGDTKSHDPANSELSLALPQALGLKSADGSDRVPLVRIEGEAAILKVKTLSVTAVATGGDVEPIDVRELKQVGQDAYLAYRYERQPVTLKLTSVKYAVQEVVETVVSRALVEVVFSRDATALFRCRYRLKSSQRQRLAIDLPAGATLLGVFLDGKPIQPETGSADGQSKEWSSYFLNLVRSKSSDEAVLLAVQFRQKYDAFEPLGGRKRLIFPRIGGPTGENVVVQQLRTAVWVPAKYALVETPDGFRAESQTVQAADHLGAGAAGPNPSELESWIGGSQATLFEFPLEGNGYVYSRLGPAESIVLTWITMPIYTLVISLAIAIIAWLLRRSRWETLATLVLGTALVAVLVALVDSELVWHLLLAARYGLVALVAIWLIEAFRRAAQSPKSALRPPTPQSVAPAVASSGTPDSTLGKEG